MLFGPGIIGSGASRFGRLGLRLMTWRVDPPLGAVGSCGIIGRCRFWLRLALGDSALFPTSSYPVGKLEDVEMTQNSDLG